MFKSRTEVAGKQQNHNGVLTWLAARNNFMLSKAESWWVYNRTANLTDSAERLPRKTQNCKALGAFGGNKRNQSAAYKVDRLHACHETLKKNPPNRHRRLHMFKLGASEDISVRYSIFS